MSRNEIQTVTERQTRPQLPGFWHFCWMFWMQPILLHERLVECGINQPDAYAIHLWRIDDNCRAVRREYVMRLAAMLFVGMPSFDFILVAILGFSGTELNYYGVALSVVLSVVFGVVFGVALSVAIAVGLLRVPILPFEIIASLGTRLLASACGGSRLRFSPVNWHDLCYFPLPGLRQQILNEAPRNPAIVRQTLQACRRSPGQRKIGAEVLSILKAREWKLLIQSRHFDDAGELRGEWLGGVREPDARLQLLAEASRFLRAASLAVVVRHRRQQVQRAQELLLALRNRLLNDRSREASEYQSALLAAESVAGSMLAEAEVLGAGELPNVFRAGDPLKPEFDQTIFRGREDLIRQIELLLNDERQAAAVLVIAPRRCGKSSLLRMLPAKLPDALCVFFDLQDNPVQTPLDLFPALEKRLREQARPQVRESLPRLKGASLEAARDWLDALEHRPGQDRVLFCLDEFERLEELWGSQGGSVFQLGAPIIEINSCQFPWPKLERAEVPVLQIRKLNRPGGDLPLTRTRDCITLSSFEDWIALEAVAGFPVDSSDRLRTALNLESDKLTCLRRLVGRTSSIRTSLTGRVECCGVTPRSPICSRFVV